MLGRSINSHRIALTESQRNKYNKITEISLNFSYKSCSSFPMTVWKEPERSH